MGRGPLLSLSILLLCCISPGFGQTAPQDSFAISTPGFVLSGIDFQAEASAYRGGALDTSYNGIVLFTGLQRDSNGVTVPVWGAFVRGRLTLEGVHVHDSGEITIGMSDGAAGTETSVRSIPGFTSILPPFLAILLALILRQVIVSLFAGIWLGAFLIFDYNPLTSLLRVMDHFIVKGLATPDHVAIVVFSLMFGGMVGVISRNGGTFGIADKLIAMARSPNRGQVSAWILGLVIFFDDYANTLIVGNTMRPVTDKLRVSREKLAYIVDSTAAPVSSLFFISTWIGYEVGLIDAAISSVNYHVESAYWIFIDTIPYRFYPIFTLILGFTIASSGRDFGPMLRAERRARSEGKLYRDGAEVPASLSDTHSMPNTSVARRWWNGAVPILTVIVVAVIGLYYTGVQSVQASGTGDFSFGNIIGSANSYQALQWSALLSCAVAIIMSVAQRLLTLTEAIEAWFHGLKSMMLAMIILVLAWGIGAVTTELHTADYMVQLLRGNLSPHWLPVLTFLVAAVISFATGTSWGTMGILMPIVIPLAAALSVAAGMNTADLHVIMLGTVSSVLAGAVFGDHCSPISDTTILSSMASACDHIDHVRTQLPYALLVAAVGMLVGDIPTAFGLSPYISIAAGAVVLIGIMFIVGRKPD